MTHIANLLRSLHEKAKAVKPDQPTKPSSYWVAVLKADKRPTDLNLAEVDFLWVKCHGVSILHPTSIDTISC
jgi:hypothetical protein